MKQDHEEAGDSCLKDGETQGLLFLPSDCSRQASDNPASGRSTSKSKSTTSRREFRWSKPARDLVRANRSVTGTALSALVTRLVEETGNPRWACRRFVRRMGIQSKRSNRAWTVQEQQRLLKLIDLHPINEIAKLMRRSESSLRHTLQRLGANAKMGKDSFTKYTLALALHVRPETIESWIARGWLKAREVKIGQGKRVVIEAEDFCEFCREHTKDVVGNRLAKERLDFVYRFAFPPSHAELLPVRESKRERVAYEEQLGGITPRRKEVAKVDECGQSEDDGLSRTA